jgi:hypothetical protein
MIALLATAVDAERAVDALVVAAHAHRAVRHPYLAAVGEGSQIASPIRPLPWLTSPTNTSAIPPTSPAISPP